MKKFYLPEIMALFGFILAFIIASCSNGEPNPRTEQQITPQRVDSVANRLK